MKCTHKPVVTVIPPHPHNLTGVRLCQELCLVGLGFFLFWLVLAVLRATFLLLCGSCTNDMSCSSPVSPGLGLTVFQASSLFSFLSLDSFSVTFFFDCYSSFVWVWPSPTVLSWPRSWLAPLIAVPIFPFLHGLRICLGPVALIRWPCRSLCLCHVCLSDILCMPRISCQLPPGMTSTDM